MSSAYSSEQIAQIAAYGAGFPEGGPVFGREGGKVYAALGAMIDGEVTTDETLTRVRTVISPGYGIPTFDEWLDEPYTARAVAPRVELQRKYDEHLAGPVSDLLASNPKPLGEGRKSFGYLLTHDDGRESVVKVLKPGTSLQVREVDRYFRFLSRAAGIEDVEQIEGMSYREGIVVGSYIPGKKLRNLSDDEFASLTDVSLSQAVDRLGKLTEQGLHADLAGDNMHAIPVEQKFGFFDMVIDPDFPKYRLLEDNLYGFLTHIREAATILRSGDGRPELNPNLLRRILVQTGRIIAKRLPTII